MRGFRSVFVVAGTVAALSACGGGGGGASSSLPAPAPTATAAKPAHAPSSTPQPSTAPSAQPSAARSSTPAPATPVPTPVPTPIPTSVPTPTFNDYTTFGYSNGRTVFNPNSTAITPANIAAIHLGWQATLGDFNTQSQPMVATEIPGHAAVLYVGGGSGRMYAVDGLTGTTIWTLQTGREVYTCGGGVTSYFGVGGTAAYDPGSKSLYMTGNSNGAAGMPAINTLYHVDGASGTILGNASFATPDPLWPSVDFTHTAVTLSPNGTAYVGTSSTCDISSWRGRIVAISTPSMTVLNTVFPVWNGTTQPWGGGGIWGWGGVSLDGSGNVYTGVGNTDDGTSSQGSIVAPFAPAPTEYSGLGESLLKLSSDLTVLEGNNAPIPPSLISGVATDLDLTGTPVIFQPAGVGCDPLAALQAKSGAIYLYDTLRIGSGPVAQYQLAPSSYADGFLGSPAFSPITGLLYVAVPSSNGSLYPPGLVAINPGCGSPTVMWEAAFGPDSYEPGSSVAPGVPRSVPAVSAGGVVLVGTICSPVGSTCGATTASSAERRAQAAKRRPLVCCTPAGTGGGAVWAVDAASGAVLNGGVPLIITGGPLRMPPTIDGNWIYVLDNNGDLYALTIDPNYVAPQAKRHAPALRVRTP